MSQNRQWQKLLAASAAVLLAVLVAVPLVRADSLDEVETETIFDPVDAYFNRLKVFGPQTTVDWCASESAFPTS